MAEYSGNNYLISNNSPWQYIVTTVGTGTLEHDETVGDFDSLPEALEAITNHDADSIKHVIEDCYPYRAIGSRDPNTK